MPQIGLSNGVTRIIADFRPRLTQIFLCAIYFFSLCHPVFSETDKLPIGEKLVYDVYWKFVKVGYSTLEIRDIVDFNGRKAYHIYSEAKSSSFFDIFFKVRDTNESWINVEPFHSLVFKQHISEGKYKRERKTYYDQNRHIAINNKDEVFEIPKNVLDVLAALYWVRLQKIKPGDNPTINVNSGKKNYTMSVKIREREKIKVNGRKYDTIVVEPDLQDAGIFMNKGRILIWMTDDKNHIPVKMKSEIAVGSIVTELISK